MQGSDFKNIPAPPFSAQMPTASNTQSGPAIEPLARVTLYSAKDWETFIEEWASSFLKAKYKSVARYSGANDHGIDIAGFVDTKKLLGVWDAYQCKHYDHPLYPGDAWPEIGKILWYSYKKIYRPPRAYYFVAPRGVGSSLSMFLSNTQKL